MLSKESKIRLLESFYSLDYLFFGDRLKSVKVDPALAENYLVLKSALSSVIIEMFKIVEHSPIIENTKIDAPSLLECASRDAKAAKIICKKLVVSEDGKADVKAQIKEILSEDSNIVKEVPILQIVKEEVERKAYSLAVDTLLIAKMLRESKRYQALNEAEGRVLEDSYKLIRDSLVETAQTIINS